MVSFNAQCARVFSSCIEILSTSIQCLTILELVMELKYMCVVPKNI